MSAGAVFDHEGGQCPSIDHGGGKRRVGVKQYKRHKMAELPSHPARFADGRTTMKHLVLSIALSALVAVAVSTTAQAYYHHRHHHYWHHGYPIAGYWNYYRTSWPGRGNDEESTR
jgi:hypothetical protein